MFFVDPAIAQSECPDGEDYSPCTCRRFSPPDGPSFITCSEVSLAQVSSVFKRTTTADLEGLNLELLADPIDIIIPMDLLSNHRARSITISCPSTRYSLKIDPQAFRSSKLLTESFDLMKCDTSLLDFNFLSGFDRLGSLMFSSMSNFDRANWMSLPPLRNLENFYIDSSTALNEWKTLPQLTKGLNQLYLKSNEIQDEAMDRILNWTVQYSAETLQELGIDGNNITQFPLQLRVPSFPKLHDLSIYGQRTRIALIPSNSFHDISRIASYLLHAENSGIETIQEGAFQGNISIEEISK